MGLKPFRSIPENIVEWTRWMREQDDAIQDVIDGTIAKGTATFTGIAEKDVTFVTAEASAGYTVVIDAAVNETFWVTNKKTTGFTLNSSNSTSTAFVRWVLVR